jgi:hypothetical protein
LGFGLHILAGTILGAAIGTIAIRLSLRSMLNPRKGTLIGIGSGVAVWLILFLPITALLVQPAVNDIVILSAIESKQAVFSVDINQSIRNIALSAIVFHLVWGAIFGFILSSLVRLHLLRVLYGVEYLEEKEEKKTLSNRQLKSNHDIPVKNGNGAAVPFY